MIRPGRVATIARFEFVSTVAKLGYVLATVGIPVLMAMPLGLSAVFASIDLPTERPDPRPRVYGIVDVAGALGLEGEVVLPEPAAPVGDGGYPGGAVGDEPAWTFRPYAAAQAAREDLEAGRIRGWAELPAAWLATGEVVAYASKQGPRPQVLQALEGVLRQGLLRGRVPDGLAARIADPVARIDRRSMEAGGEGPASPFGFEVLDLAVPFVWCLLFFLALTTSTAYLGIGVANDKENRVVELLLSSARADELLAGKLFGLGSAALLQVAVWSGAAVAAALAVAVGAAESGLEVPWSAIAAGAAFFLPFYFFMGSLVVGASSLAATPKGGQQIAGLFTLPTFAALTVVLFSTLAAEGTSTAVRVLCWIPFTSPIAWIARLAKDRGPVPVAELAGSLALLLASTAAALVAGGRLYRVGLLLTGAGPSLTQILRQARLLR